MGCAVEWAASMGCCHGACGPQLAAQQLQAQAAMATLQAQQAAMAQHQQQQKLQAQAMAARSGWSANRAAARASPRWR